MDSQKKRILIFSTAYFPFIGGAEIAVKEITSRIDDFEFIMVSPRLDKKLPETELIHNLTIHRIGKGNNFDKLRLILQGPKYAKSLGKFNAVWSIMASYAGFAALRYKKQNKDIPFLLTLQEGDSKAHIYKRVWFVWPYFKQIFIMADYVQAISKYLADWAKEMGARCPVKIVPNGVDIKNLDYNKKSNDLKRVITVSRLVKKNGLQDLLEAIKLVNKNFSQPVILKIIGDGKLKNKLKKLAIKFGLVDRFAIKDEKEIFQGTVPHKEIYNYLKQSDVFVRPSISEGLGNAFLEAMAVELPVIGTRVGGIPDFLIDGETGWFCEVNNPQSIAEKIKYILDEKNKQEVEKVVKNAKEMVQKKYSWDLIAQKMDDIFNSMVK